MITYTYFTQTVVDGPTQAPVSYELLLRYWDAERKQWLLPEDFEISVRMQVRLMKQLLATLPNKHVSLNLTAKQFADEATFKQLAAFVAEERNLGTLSIELTQAPTLATLTALAPQYHDAGIALALDDVGTDIADFAQVEALAPQVDMLKYALQNLRALGRESEADTEITRYKALADRYALDFVLEGVESFADVQLAHRLRVDWMQGFYFSKPVERNR